MEPPGTRRTSANKPLELTILPSISPVTPLLDVRHLVVSYPTPQGPVYAVRDVSFQIAPGEILALVGETGCGKSTLALSLLGLMDRGRQIESGQIFFEGCDIPALGAQQWRRIRGGKIGMVFQDPRSALNQVLSVGEHLIESLRAHQDLARRQAWRRSVELLAEVGFPDPELNMRRYPFQLSGGMCQRLGIALGICNRPALLIADEPTSGLDPSIQQQILELLKHMTESYRLALLLDQSRSTHVGRFGRSRCRHVSWTPDRSWHSGGGFQPTGSPLYPGPSRVSSYASASSRSGTFTSNLGNPAGSVTGVAGVRIRAAVPSRRGTMYALASTSAAAFGNSLGGLHQG